jgi:pilus assembly protein CpaE
MLMRVAHTPEYLREAQRAGVREVLPSPVGEETLRAAVRRMAAGEGAERASGGRKVVAILPCKGGCGATFLATNLACELGRRHTVLLVDLNLQFGDAFSFVRRGRAARTLADLAGERERLDAALLAASTTRIARGFSILAAPDDPGSGVEIQPEDVDAVVATASRHYEYVVLDLPRTLDPASLRGLDRATCILPVLQPTVPAIHDAARLRHVLLALGYPAPKMRFVVNGCGDAMDIGPDQIQRSLGGGALVTLGEDAREVTSSINRGEPIVQGAPSHPIALQIAALAAELAPRPGPTKGLFGRMFGGA